MTNKRNKTVFYSGYLELNLSRGKPASTQGGQLEGDKGEWNCFDILWAF